MFQNGLLLMKESPPRGLFFIVRGTAMDNNAGELEEILSPLIENMGLSLVEITTGRHRGAVQVHIVLHKKGGIGLDDLTAAQKVIRPRLELEFSREDLSLEVSSPGITRTFRNPREYLVFDGSRVRILLNDEWISGVLAGSDSEFVRLEDINGEIQEYPVGNIRKAKRD